jgi:hypothetical protein
MGVSMTHKRPEVERSWRNDPNQQNQPEQEPPEQQQDGDPEDADPQDGDAQNSDSQNSDSQQGDPQDGGQPEGSPQDESPEDGDPQDGSPQDASLQDGQGGQESEIEDLLSDEASGPEPTKEEREQAKALNDQISEDDSDRNWQSDHKSVRHKAGASESKDGTEESYVGSKYGTHTAEKIEDQIKEFAYEINQQDVGTDWSPQDIEDHRVARMFSVIVGKLAEDISYQEINGDEFWDAKKIMKRQVDNRPLHSCKKDYKQRKLALLVDTSPSCREEAILYSKIASGAMLRNDIDIFLCPNGHIDARFDRERMEFVTDDRRKDWDLDGRTILYFTDWDGVEQICHHSRSTNLYWFDNCDPTGYWNANDQGTREIRSRFRGTHYHCPDKDTFVTLSRKIRP